MDKQTSDDLDRILEDLDLQHIPEEFVTAARVTDLDGDVRIVGGEELEEIMLSPETFREQGIRDMRLMLNLELIKESIYEHSERILSSVPA